MEFPPTFIKLEPINEEIKKYYVKMGYQLTIHRPELEQLYGDYTESAIERQFRKIEFGIQKSLLEYCKGNELFFYETEVNEFTGVETYQRYVEGCFVPIRRYRELLAKEQELYKLLTTYGCSYEGR